MGETHAHDEASFDCIGGAAPRLRLGLPARGEEAHRDSRSYSYETAESPLPVKNYKAKFWVEPDDEPERTAVYWEAEFDANGASDADARNKVNDVLTAGMRGIKQVALKTTEPSGGTDRQDDQDK